MNSVLSQRQHTVVLLLPVEKKTYIFNSSVVDPDLDPVRSGTLFPDQDPELFFLKIFIGVYHNFTITILRTESG